MFTTVYFILIDKVSKHLMEGMYLEISKPSDVSWWNYKQTTYLKECKFKSIGPPDIHKGFSKRLEVCIKIAEFNLKLPYLRLSSYVNSPGCKSAWIIISFTEVNFI